MRRRALPILLSCALGLLGAVIGTACGDDPAPPSSVDAASDVVDPPDSAAPLDATAPVPRGTRVLGVSVDIATVDFVRDVELARDAGLQATNVTFAWDDVEGPIDGGADDAGDDAGSTSGTQLFQPGLHITNLVLSGTNTRAMLAVDAFDVGGSRAPADLRARPIDDPELAGRYERLLDYVFSQVLDTNVATFSVASSVDALVGSDAARHAAFAAFFGRVAAHARSVRPGLAVGFTVSGDSLASPTPFTTPAWSAADFIGVTVLPVSAEGAARAAGSVEGEIDRIVAAAPAEKPIVLREIGYPTSALTGSDEAAQSAFVAASFRAWDRHAGRISAVVFRELDDAPETVAAAVAARYGRSDPAFLSALQSLGLRASGGRRKPGFDAFFREARARGW